MSLKKHLAVIGFYALIAMCALHNPIAHVTTTVPGTSPVDFYHFHWNYWWIRHALTTPGLNVYLTNYVMAPFTSNLAYHTLAAFWFPLWALLEPLCGTLVAMMVIMVVAFTLAGYSFFVLLRREGAALGLALVGGVMLQLMPTFFIASAYTNMNLLGWFWLPTLLLLWGEIANAAPIPQPLSPPLRLRHGERGGIRTQAGGVQVHAVPTVAPSDSGRGGGIGVRVWRAMPDVRWTLALAFALYGMVMTDLQYPVFAAFLIVPYGLYSLWRAENWTRRLRLVGIAAGGLGLALLLLWFVGPLPYMLRFSSEGLAFTPAAQANALPFPSGYLYQMVEGAPIATLSLPLLLLALIVYFLRASGRFKIGIWRTAGSVPRGFWLLLIPLPLVLAVGPVTPLYVAFHQLLGGMFRYPERFTAVYLIPSLLFAMPTLTPLWKRGRTPLTAALLLLVLAGANIFHSLPVQPVPPPYEFYAAMGREPYDYVIVDVPTAGASGQGIVGEAQFITTQFYGIVHGKRMINGHISRVNTWQYMYMESADPLMSWLGQRRTLEPEAVEAELREHIFSYPIGYFVIHRRFIDPGRFPTVIDEITTYFNSLPDLLCPYTVENDAIVYRTRWHPDGCAQAWALPEVEAGVYLLDIGAAEDVFHIGAGWHWQENVAGLSARWMGAAPQTPIYVELPPASYEMTFTAQSYLEPRQVQILVNGAAVGEPLAVTADALHEYSVTIPAALIADGERVTVSFAYDTALVPAQIGQGGDTRALALLVDTVTFRRVGG